MDKKIILSLVIVALIGIVAATYQININDDLLNPFSSVDTEDSPITDTLATPAQAAQQGSNTQPSEAQKQAQAQQAKDQQAQAQAAQSQDNQQPQAQGSALITANNPVTTTGENTNPTDGNSQGDKKQENSGNPTNPNNPQNPGSPTDPESPQNPGNPNPQPTPDPNPKPTPDPTPDDDNPTMRTIIQAYSYITKQKIGNLEIIENSGYYDTGANGQPYVVFLAKNTKIADDDTTYHIWIPRNSNSGFTWYIEESGTGPNDVDPVPDNDDQTPGNET